MARFQDIRQFTRNPAYRVDTNCRNWNGSANGPFVLVDGKQRLAAVLLNDGGVVHSQEEFDRVRGLLEADKARTAVVAPEVP